MKKTLSICGPITLLFIASMAFSWTGMSIYKNEQFNYSITVPSSWKTVDLNLQTKHIMYTYLNKSTEIKVKALRSEKESIDSIINKNKWNLRSIDHRLNKIIETKNIKIRKNISGKLLVFEYRSNRNSILQRTLVTRNNDIIYIIECRAPTRTFYNYEDFFSAALSSFSYINTAEENDTADSDNKVNSRYSMEDGTIDKLSNEIVDLEKSW